MVNESHILAAELATKEEITSTKLLLNRVRPNLIKNNEMMSVDDVAEILEIPLNNSEKHKLLYSASVMHSTLDNLKINITV